MEAAHKYGSLKNIVRFEGHIDNSLFLTILTEYCDGGELSRQIGFFYKSPIFSLRNNF